MVVSMLIGIYVVAIYVMSKKDANFLCYVVMLSVMQSSFMKDLKSFFENSEFKKSVKELVRPILEIIIIEILPYILFFIIVLFFHITLSIYLVQTYMNKN